MLICSNESSSGESHRWLSRSSRQQSTCVIGPSLGVGMRSLFVALCDQLKHQLNVGEQLSRRLLEAVLQKAFVEPEKALASVGST
jgi:hypothetical protein